MVWPTARRNCYMSRAPSAYSLHSCCSKKLLLQTRSLKRWMMTRDLFAVADFLVTNYDHVFVFVLLVWLLERRNSITATVASVAADLATCSICLGLFVNPKSLPCLHAFCLECLRDSFKDKRPGDKVPCPICRKGFQIPANGLRSLQHHFIVQQLVDLQLGICTHVKHVTYGSAVVYVFVTQSITL